MSTKPEYVLCGAPNFGSSLKWIATFHMLGLSKHISRRISLFLNILHFKTTIQVKISKQKALVMFGDLINIFKTSLETNSFATM